MSSSSDRKLLAEIAPTKLLREGKNEAEVQSGDMQGLSWAETNDSESVRELVAEGQTFEAEAILGVQEAGDERVRAVKTRQMNEDDVPLEYLDAER